MKTGVAKKQRNGCLVVVEEWEGERQRKIPKRRRKKGCVKKSLLSFCVFRDRRLSLSLYVSTLCRQCMKLFRRPWLQPSITETNILQTPTTRVNTADISRQTCNFFHR